MTGQGQDNSETKHETFGHGIEANIEAGKKGGAISAARPEEDRKASAQKAAQTRKERGTANGN